MAPVALLFFLSGFSGLLYEVLWAKYLALALGGAALANTIVLAAFLGGLAWGNAFWGPRADRSAPMRLYAFLELGIAAVGLMSPSLLGLLHPALAPCAALPAFLMGGTLPALAVWAVGRRGVGAAVSRLYFLNSAGAALGALAAGFVLIPALGLAGSFYAAAALSAAVGLGGLALSRGEKEASAPAAVESAPAARRARVLCGVVFASGAAALLYETAWIRVLALVFGASVYSFCVMLAAFIAGLALGSLWVARGRGRLHACLLLGLAELGAALSLALTLPFYDKLPYCFFRILNALPRSPSYYPVYEGAKFLVAFLLMLPPAAALGAALPLASEAAAPPRGRVGGGVGRLFGFNALGNVLGAAAALALLPRLGISGLFTLGAAFNLAAGGAAMLLDGSRNGRRKAAAVAACVLAVGWSALARPWNRMFLSMGTFRLAGAGGIGYRDYKNVFNDYRLLYYKDDSDVTAAVLRHKDGKLSLLLDGKADASSGKDMRTQLLLAHVPLILSPGARRVLVVGLGSGVTAGAALAHPLEALDVVEISRGVAEASRLFEPYNRRALSDPRARLHLQDAKAFLRREGGSYDLVISEPSNPWVAGMGGLFSAEFYRSARGRLRSGGVMAQWLHVYEMTDDTLRLVLRTFCCEFKSVSLWHTYGNDILLLGSEKAPAFDFARMEAAFSAGPVRRDLAGIGLESLGSLLALQSSGDGGARALGGAGPVNEDLFPRLEYRAPKALFLREISSLVDDSEDFSGPRAGELVLRRYLSWRKRPLSKEEFKGVVEFQEGYRRPFLRGVLAEWGRLYARDPEYRLTRARSEMEALDYEAAHADLLDLARTEPGKPLYLELCADAELELYRVNGKPALARLALDHLKKAAGLPGADRAPLYHKIARVHKERGETKAALLYLDKAALAARPEDALAPDDFWMEAAELAWDKGDKKGLMDNLEKALKRNPANRKGRDMFDILNH